MLSFFERMTGCAPSTLIIEREALVRKSDEEDALVQRTTEDTTLPAPEPEPEGFNALQIDALAIIRNELCDELRAEWQRDIERLEQRLLQTVFGWCCQPRSPKARFVG